MASETPEQMAGRLRGLAARMTHPLNEAALKAGAAALRASLSREDREQALDEAFRAGINHEWHASGAGDHVRRMSRDQMAEARRLLKLDPTPTEDKS
jgi:hypothetical protein